MKFTNLIIFIFLQITIFGQTITTDRPTQTTGPTTVSKGMFQLETGARFSTGNYLQLPGNLFRIGLSRTVELRVVNGITFRSNYNKVTAQFSNFELGLKVQLLNKEGKKTQIGIIAHGNTTTLIDKWYSQRGFYGILAFNHKLNSRNNLSYNLGYRMNFTDLNNYIFVWHNLFGTLNYSHSLTDRLSLFTEVYGGIHDYEQNFNEVIDRFDLNFDMGLTWLLKDNLQLDYSFGYGIFDRMNFQSIGLSFYIAPRNK